MPVRTPGQLTLVEASPTGVKKAEAAEAVEAGGSAASEAARADVFRFVEVEYNRTRLRKHRTSPRSKPGPCYGKTSPP